MEPHRPSQRNPVSQEHERCEDQDILASGCVNQDFGHNIFVCTYTGELDHAFNFLTGDSVYFFHRCKDCGFIDNITDKLQLLYITVDSSFALVDLLR